MKYRFPASIIIFFTVTFFSQSCTSVKQISYFSDFEDSVQLATINTANFKSAIVQPDDLLAITVQTLEPEVNVLLNIPNSSNTGETLASNTATTVTTPIYLVDKNGEIELPFTGKVKVQGLTIIEAKEAIRQQMIKFVKEPIINIKFTNFKVIVMGEVANPNTYVMPTERVTIFDALSKAGDITAYGKKDNVVLIRDSQNQKTMVHLNLNSKDIFSSPWLYLQSNDIIYVEPSKAKAVSTDAVTTRNIALGLSTLSIIVGVLNILIR